MPSNPNPIQRETGQKIAKISTQSKLKWMKFDTEFQGRLEDP